MQSEPIKRDILVRQPKELHGRRGALWKLAKLPCVIKEADGQWAGVFEKWTTVSAALQRVRGVSELYLKSNHFFSNGQGDKRYSACWKIE